MAIKAPRLLHLIQGQDFPDYEFREYPKMVKSANEFDSKGLPLVVTVNDKDEEKAATTKKEDKPAKEDLPRKDKPQSEVLGDGKHPASVHVDKEEEDEDTSKAEALKTNVPGTGGMGATTARAPTFKPSATTAQAAAKTQAESLAETPGGVVKP